jgi:hypothetical protein
MCLCPFAVNTAKPLLSLSAGGIAVVAGKVGRVHVLIPPLLCAYVMNSVTLFKLCSNLKPRMLLQFCALSLHVRVTCEYDLVSIIVIIILRLYPKLE